MRIGGFMKACVIESPKKLVIDEQPLKLIEGTVKVKITRTLISATDIALFLGKDIDKLPLVPCRIATGLVSEADETSSFHKGEKVLLSPYIADKIHGINCNGFLRDYAIVPETHLISIPERISEDEMVLVDYIALASACLHELDIKEHQYIVVLGTGVFPLILAQLVDYYRAIPIVVGKNEEDLSLAEDIGICYRINSEKQDPQQRIMEITSGVMADCTVFECVAGINPQLALSLTKKGGKVCIAGFSAYMNRLAIDMRTILARQLYCVGVSGGKESLMTAINLLATKAVDVKGLVTAREYFNGVEDLFLRLADGDYDATDVYIDVD